RAHHPEVRFSLHLSDSMTNLVGDDIDLAIRYGQPPDSSMIARTLTTTRRVVCVAPALAERGGRPATPDDLATLPCLALITAAGVMHEWRYQQGGTTHVARINPCHESNDGEIIRRWALVGQGFAYKSLLDVADDLRAGRLETVLDDYFRESTPLNALFQGRVQPPRVRALIDFLQDRFTALSASLG
ncbi:MAG: substrate binding domain-containing protein, partial [Paludibacterium sp.]